MSPGTTSHKPFMSSSMESCEISFITYSNSNDFNDPISSQFCTCHDSSAVMACEKLWSDLVILSHIKATHIFCKKLHHELINPLWNGSLFPASSTMPSTWERYKSWVNCQVPLNCQCVLPPTLSEPRYFLRFCAGCSFIYEHTASQEIKYYEPGGKILQDVWQFHLSMHTYNPNTWRHMLETVKIYKI